MAAGDSSINSGVGDSRTNRRGFSRACMKCVYIVHKSRSRHAAFYIQKPKNGGEMGLHFSLIVAMEKVEICIFDLPYSCITAFSDMSARCTAGRHKVRSGRNRI